MERVYSESWHQVELMRWSSLCEYREDLVWLHKIANEQSGGAIRGARAKAEGVRAGVADLFLPLARGQWHGLYIELKQLDTGRQSSRQIAFEQHCAKVGYRYALCHGWEEARDEIVAYLNC